MKSTRSHDEQIAQLTYAEIYPHYLAKIEKKGRTKEELHQAFSDLRNNRFIKPKDH